MAQPIRSDDPQALEKLKDRLELLKINHQKMKEENEHYRKNGTMRGFGDLTDEKAAQRDAKIAHFVLRHTIQQSGYTAVGRPNQKPRERTES